MTQSSGLAALTVKSSGWCSIVADLDNDGWKDIFTANSHVNDRIGDFEALEFRQPNSLFLNDGYGRFRGRHHRGRPREHPGRAPRLRGRRLQRRRPSRSRRGVARFGGGVVAERRLPGVEVVDRAPDRHEEQPRRHRRAGHRRQPGADDDHGDGYASSSHAGLHFGLGEQAGPVRVEVLWPSGSGRRSTTSRSIAFSTSRNDDMPMAGRPLGLLSIAFCVTVAVRSSAVRPACFALRTRDATPPIVRAAPQPSPADRHPCRPRQLHVQAAVSVTGQMRLEQRDCGGVVAALDYGPGRARAAGRDLGSIAAARWRSGRASSSRRNCDNEYPASSRNADHPDGPQQWRDARQCPFVVPGCVAGGRELEGQRGFSGASFSAAVSSVTASWCRSSARAIVARDARRSGESASVSRCA